MVKTFTSRDIYQRIVKLLLDSGEAWTDPETSDEYTIFEFEPVEAGASSEDRSVCFAMKLSSRNVTVYTANEFLYLVFDSDGTVRKPPAEPTLGLIDEWLDAIEAKQGTHRSEATQS